MQTMDEKYLENDALAIAVTAVEGAVKFSRRGSERDEFEQVAPGITKLTNSKLNRPAYAIQWQEVKAR
jgi:hypothetical protein